MSDQAGESFGQLALFDISAPAVTHLEAVIDVGQVHLCGGCKRMLPVSQFNPAPFGRGGFGSCIVCSTRNVRVTRGVAREDAAMVAPEGQCCEVCGGAGTARGMFLDHNHTTGRFRGWLCHGCNTGIGHMRDNPYLLRKAAAYLDERGAYSLRTEETA